MNFFTSKVAAGIAVVAISVGAWADNFSPDFRGDWAGNGQCGAFDEIGVPDAGVTISRQSLSLYEKTCTIESIQFANSHSLTGTLNCEDESGAKSKRVDLSLRHDGKLLMTGMPLMEKCPDSAPVVNALSPDKVLDAIQFKHRFAGDKRGRSSLAWVIKEGYFYYQYIVEPCCNDRFLQTSNVNGTLRIEGIERNMRDKVGFDVTMHTDDAQIEKDGNRYKRIVWTGYKEIPPEAAKYLFTFVFTDAY